MSLPGICASSVSHHGLHWKTLRPPSQFCLYDDDFIQQTIKIDNDNIFFVLNIHKFQAAAPILADETTVQRWAVQFLLKLECGSTHASQINIVTHLCYNQICITPESTGTSEPRHSAIPGLLRIFQLFPVLCDERLHRACTCSVGSSCLTLPVRCEPKPMRERSSQQKYL